MEIKSCECIPSDVSTCSPDPDPNAVRVMAVESTLTKWSDGSHLNKPGDRATTTVKIIAGFS